MRKSLVADRRKEAAQKGRREIGQVISNAMRRTANLSDKEKRLAALWPLLLKDTHLMTDAELTEILENKDAVSEGVFRIEHIYWWVETEKKYRTRKAELSGKPTEDLQVIAKKIADRREYLRHSGEDLDDSFYEAPSKDTDEYIVAEILRERGVK